MKKIIMLLALVLMGCQTDPVIRDVIVPPPAKLVTPCRPSPGLNMATYVTLSWEEREDALTKELIDSYGALAKCNGQVDSIKKYYDDLKATK